MRVVDNPQHTFIFTANTEYIQTVVFCRAPLHERGLYFLFRLQVSKHFHFMGAGIQQGQ